MLDAFCLSAITDELTTDLTGGRIDKVFMPERDEVHLAIRSQNLGNVRLLISAGQRAPRAHLTEISKENPATPPMFCMFLRKHLTGARILSIEQPPLERVVIFSLSVTDELGVPSQKKLVAELMGRNSNLIVVDAENRILDCLRRVDSDMSEKRPVLPGLFYHLPPGMGKRNVLQLSIEQISELIAHKQPDIPYDKWIMDTFWGVSPLLAREIAFRAESTSLPDALCSLVQLYQAREFTPTMLTDNDKPVDFSFMPILQYKNLYVSHDYPRFSLLLDDFYTQRDHDEHTRQRAQSLIKTVSNARDRVTRKMSAQFSELQTAQDKERLRQFGDLLTTNLHLIPTNSTNVTLTNYYDPELSEIEIKLNPLLSPQQNAAKYYKDYTRMKTAEKLLTEQLAQGEKEREYLESVLEALSRASGERDVREIREELEQGGYVSRSQGKRMKTPPSQPMVFRSTTGTRFLAGRNNQQNDMLTLKLSDKNDLWLHTQKIPGTHVIVPGGKPDDQTLLEAATVAATLSKAKNSPKVPVDYTQVKYVKKPGGLKPGMVIYDKFQTILVDPDAKLLERLRESP